MKTPNLPVWDLQNYVLALIKQSGQRIHSSQVIPPMFDQFPSFATVIFGLKYDNSTGWFSIDTDIYDIS